MQELGSGTIGGTVLAVRYTLSRQLSPWIRRMISRVLLIEANERKVGQSNAAEPAGLATATSISTCFIDIYPNIPRSID